jgi:predicted O-methyltransferase YrrM
MLGKNWGPADLFKLSSWTWAACALQAAISLDLFTALDTPPTGAGLPPDELARRLKCNPRALGMLVTALVSLNLLEREQEQVRLTEASRLYLSANSKEYYGYFLKHAANILPGWANLASAVETGTGEAVLMATDDEKERENFLLGMYNVARQQAEAVASALDLSGRRRLLDLGGGPGTYAIYFCRRFPGLTATVFDQPGTEKIAQTTIAKYGLTKRIDFAGGHYLESELPGGFDVVWLSQILHSEGPIQAARLVQRGADSLESGGLLGIQEFLLNDDQNGPAQSALFSLNMLLQTEAGQAYTQREVTLMMTGAGLKNIRRLQAEIPPHCGIIIGEKP